jgi:hypothetical protein
MTPRTRPLFLRNQAAYSAGTKTRGSLGILGAHRQAVLDLVHGDQHRFLPVKQRFLGARRLRTDAGVDAPRIEDRRRR